jgi:glycine N-methyltransferase
MVDSVYRTRSLGVAAEGLPDQYADGKAAKVWEFYIGSKQTRTSQYKEWFSSFLKDRNIKTVLDVACGTGVDSIMLLEDGFDVFSTDASDKMLKYALKERWARRKEEAFDKWVIDEANWLSLEDDLDEIPEKPEQGFDAVICLGNSFAHLPDFEGNQGKQKLALSNFKALVKPGGYLIIDHRNYDEILKTGHVPAKNVYYNSDCITDMKCSNMYVNARPTMVTLDYTLDMSILAQQQEENNSKKMSWDASNSTHKFRLSYYPHRLGEFTNILKEIFGPEAEHIAFGDFKTLGEIDEPAYYIHIIQKAHK